jgi:hypothetical protein
MEKDFISIQELLFNRGLNKDEKIKLVRHKDNREVIVVDNIEYKECLFDLYRYNKSAFMTYQSEQGNEVFKNVDYIVSFIGEEGSTARFVGVYKVFPVQLIEKGEAKYFYPMEEVSGFEALKERVIIDWGKSALAWHQWIYNVKEVVEITPGLNHVQFSDYTDFVLDFHQLKEIFEMGYPDWKKMLSAVNCIYVISDAMTGKQYVGSTYGKDGIWGRWSVYAKEGHGKDISLIELVNIDPSYAKNFRFTIMKLLPRIIAMEEAIKMETQYKKKLGTNAFGLNNN